MDLLKELPLGVLAVVRLMVSQVCKTVDSRTIARCGTYNDMQHMQGDAAHTMRCSTYNDIQHIQLDAAHAETTRWLESVCQCWHHRGHSQTPLPTSLLCGVETCDCEVPKCLLYNLLSPQCPIVHSSITRYTHKCGENVSFSSYPKSMYLYSG